MASARHSGETSPPVVTYHIFFFPKSKSSVARGRPLTPPPPALLSAERVSCDPRLPPLGRPSGGGRAGATPGPGNSGTFLRTVPRPGLVGPVGWASRLASALSWQAETPLSRTCRQNAPPLAEYHCSPRRSAGAAVRLHHRQREYQEDSGGSRAPRAHPVLGPAKAPIPLVPPLAQDVVVIFRQEASDVLGHFAVSGNLHLFSCFEKTGAD